MGKRRNWNAGSNVGRRMAFLRVLGWLLWLPLVAAGLLALVVVVRRLGAPWPPAAFDLSQPIGPETAAALHQPADACRALFARAGVHVRTLPPVTDGPACGYAHAIAWGAGGARGATYRPSDPPLDCALGLGLALWEWQVVQPAATQLLGATVTGIDQYGSYNCRRIAGRPSWSEHAHARALDVAGFRLDDGRRISVAHDWAGDGPAATFLHRVRNGACRLFGTTLSPDYNAAHRDHLHLDVARRGWAACR